MIAVKEKKIAAIVLSSLFVLLVFTGSSCAFISSNSKYTSTRSRYDTSIGVGNILGLFDDGKKKLVKSMAGEYDSAAIQDRINLLIDDNPVLMFSFTT